MPGDEYARIQELRESRPEWMIWRASDGLFYAVHKESRHSITHQDLTELIARMDGYEWRWLFETGR